MYSKTPPAPSLSRSLPSFLFSLAMTNIFQTPWKYPAFNQSIRVKNTSFYWCFIHSRLVWHSTMLFYNVFFLRILQSSCGWLGGWGICTGENLRAYLFMSQKELRVLLCAAEWHLELLTSRGFLVLEVVYYAFQSLGSLYFSISTSLIIFSQSHTLFFRPSSGNSDSFDLYRLSPAFLFPSSWQCIFFFTHITHFSASDLFISHWWTQPAGPCNLGFDTCHSHSKHVC